MDKQQKFRVGAVAALLAAGFAASFFIYAAIGGLIGLAIAGVLGGAILALAPATASWLAALKFKALKAVISRAPIEELYRLAKDRREKILHARDRIRDCMAVLHHLRAKVTHFRKQYPDEAEQYSTRLLASEKRLAFMVEKFKKAKQEEAAFLAVIDKAEAHYEMAVAEADVAKALGQSYDFMESFREKVAFDAVERAAAKAMAELDIAIIEDGAVPDEPVHAVNYDAGGNVVLGNILDLDDLNTPRVAQKA